MKYAGRLLSYTVLIFSLFCPVRAQETEAIIRLADDLFAQERYEHAVKEYQRALFFGPAYRTAYLNRQLGETCFLRGEYPRAADYFDLAMNLQENDSLYTELQFRKILSYVLARQYRYALIELFGMPDSLPPDLLNRKAFYTGICYFHLEEPDKAFESFAQALENADSDKREALFRLTDQRKKYDRPRPRTARNLSLFFPGSGQFYAGDIRNGLNSIVLNTAILGLAWSTAIEYSLIDAVVSVFPWLQRYWQGGYIRAEEIARQKRDENRNEMYGHILELFE